MHGYKTFCFSDHYFEEFRAIKLIQQLAVSLAFKGSISYAPCIGYSCSTPCD